MRHPFRHALKRSERFSHRCFPTILLRWSRVYSLLGYLRAHNLLLEEFVHVEVSRHVRAPRRLVMVTEELNSSITHRCLYRARLYYVNYTYSLITFTTIVNVHVLIMIDYNRQYSQYFTNMYLPVRTVRTMSSPLRQDARHEANWERNLARKTTDGVWLRRVDGYGAINLLTCFVVVIKCLPHEVDVLGEGMAMALPEHEVVQQGEGAGEGPAIQPVTHDVPCCCGAVGASS
jgi:hypothetical protein